MIFKVMVVDDETPIRNWIVTMLKTIPECFAVCGQARDGEEALRKVESSQPDLILADIQMPKISGLQLLERLKQVSPNTEVVILSNFDDFSYVRTAFKDGVLEYFLKSEFDKEKLLSVYDSMLQRKKKKKTAHFHQTIKNQFIYRLLNKEEMSEKELRELLKEYEIDLLEWEIAGVEVYIPENRKAEEIICGIEELDWDSAITHVNLFLVSHPLRFIMLFNINKNSVMQRDQIYRECARQISEKLQLPAGTTTIQSGAGNIQKIVKSCEAAVVKQWSQKKTILPERGVTGTDHDRELSEFYEIEMLCQEMYRRISRKDNEKMSELLEAFLMEVHNIRTFYPIQTDALLKELYCRFSEAVSPVRNLQERLQLEDEAGNVIEHTQHEYIVRVMREMKRKYERSISGVSDITRQVVDYIQEHYAEISSMQEIADNLNYNGDYLYRRFKQEMKLSFVNYLTQVRLEKAAEMMRGKNMDPAMAAEKVGYSSVSYFNKKFKEYYGLMPSAWKKTL